MDSNKVKSRIYGFKNIEISNRGHLIHKLKAKDSTDRWAYYFVYVEPHRERDFMKAIGGKGMIDLEHYGTVVASCYGERPDEETLAMLRTRFGFRI